MVQYQRGEKWGLQLEITHFRFVHVKVVAGVGPAHDHENEVFARVETEIVHWRLQQVLIVPQPVMEWRGIGNHTGILHVRADATGSIQSSSNVELQYIEHGVACSRCLSEIL